MLESIDWLSQCMDMVDIKHSSTKINILFLIQSASYRKDIDSSVYLLKLKYFICLCKKQTERLTLFKSMKNLARLPNSVRDSDNIFFSKILVVLSICLVMACTTSMDPEEVETKDSKTSLLVQS